jgi:hypothetical protein
MEKACSLGHGGSGLMSHMRFAKLLSVVVVATAVCSGPFAHAQERVNARDAATSSAPWYERFTFGTETSSSTSISVPRAQPRSDLRVSPGSRWGVSFGVQEDASQRSNGQRQRSGQTTAGAFYEITPNVRVRGQVVVPSNAETEAWRRTDDNRRRPGLKVESAFRF